MDVREVAYWVEVRRGLDEAIADAHEEAAEDARRAAERGGR